jgi:hypothetical protein
VWEASVVLAYVKTNEFSDRIDGVKRVEIKPLMFQDSPPGFDQRI